MTSYTVGARHLDLAGGGEGAAPLPDPAGVPPDATNT